MTTEGTPASTALTNVSVEEVSCEAPRPLFNKTLKTSLHRPSELVMHRDVFMFYETEPCYQRKKIKVT